MEKKWRTSIVARVCTASIHARVRQRCTITFSEALLPEALLLEALLLEAFLLEALLHEAFLLEALVLDACDARGVQQFLSEMVSE